MTRRFLAGAAVLAACMLAPPTAIAAEGDDDPSFNGGNGVFVTPAGNPNRTPHVALAPDGDVISVAFFQGNSELEQSDKIAVLRRRSDGTPETGFDGDGFLMIDAPGELLDVRVLADGRLAVLASSGGGTRLVLLKPDGKPDGDAVTTATSCEEVSQARAARIRPDGGRVVLLNCMFNDSQRGGGEPERPFDLVQRVSPAGAVEGTATKIDGTELSGEGEFVASLLALGADGRIFVGGDTYDAAFNSSPRIVVFTAAGAPLAFAGDVPATVDGSAVDAEDLVIDGKGRALLALDTFSKPWRIARFASGGGLDPSYDGDGVAAGSTDAMSSSVRTIAVDREGRVYASGNAAGGSGNADVLVRFTEAGKLDPAFAGGVGRVFEDPDEDCPHGSDLSSVLQQEDGLIVLGVTGGFCGEGGSFRAFNPPNSAYLGLLRLSATRPPAPKTPDPQPQPNPDPKPQVQLIPPVSIEIPSQNVCGSARNFRIRLRTGRSGRERSPIVSAVVKVNGKRVKVNKGKRWTALVNLKGLPKGRFTVSIAVKMADGGTAKETRRYRTCVPGMSFNFKRLVTHPPKKR